MFARPIFPRLWPPGWNGPPLGSPGLRTPPTKSRTTHARAGTGHRARTWNYTLNSSSVDLQSDSSLVTRDLVSQVALRKRGPRRLRKLVGANAVVWPALGRDDRFDSDVAIAKAWPCQRGPEKRSSSLMGVAVWLAARHSRASDGGTKLPRSSWNLGGDGSDVMVTQ
jgi:hypothetical protein